MVKKTSEIKLIDTRGQIFMDENEKKQLDLMIQGRVKNGVKVEQRT